MKNTKRTLILRNETLLILRPSDLRQAVGGVMHPTGLYTVCADAAHPSGLYTVCAG